MLVLNQLKLSPLLLCCLSSLLKHSNSWESTSYWRPADVIKPVLDERLSCTCFMLSKTRNRRQSEVFLIFWHGTSFIICAILSPHSIWAPLFTPQYLYHTVTDSNSTDVFSPRSDTATLMTSLLPAGAIQMLCSSHVLAVFKEICLNSCSVFLSAQTEWASIIRSKSFPPLSASYC